MPDELNVLLSGYLDGELDEEDVARVERALAADPALRAELEDLRLLKEGLDAAGHDARTDAELHAFWGSVYNRLERHTAWVLLLAGAFGLTAAALVFFFRDPARHWTVKAALAAALLGAALLLASVWRERRRVLPHDRYHHEVHR